MAMTLRHRPSLIFRHLDLDSGDAGARKAVGIGPAPEFTVGDDRKACVFLQSYGITDCRVFNCGQFFAADPADRMLVPCAQQLRWAQQAADVLGAKGGWQLHGTLD